MDRLEVLTTAGLKALGQLASPGEQRLVRAVAKMIDLAVRRPRERKPPVDNSKLPYSPGEVFELLETHCSDVVQLRPYEKSSFARLGRTMVGIAGLERADLERVTAWIQSGGLSWWTTQVTWMHVVKHYATWVGYARAWESKGGGAVQAHHGSDSWR